MEIENIFPYPAKIIEGQLTTIDRAKKKIG